MDDIDTRREPASRNQSLLRAVNERNPNLVQRFRVGTVPTLCVVEGTRFPKRIPSPRGCHELARELAPWRS